MALFTAADLTDFAQYPVSESAATIAERVAWGWLKDATRLTTRPAPVPEEMFSWAIELGLIAHENPGGLSDDTLGDATQRWDRARRAEILARAAAWASGAGADGTPKPRGAFPKALPWPDPAACPTDRYR